MKTAINTAIPVARESGITFVIAKQEKYAAYGAENFAKASRAAVEDMIADINGALERR